jgi:predicted permease
MLVKNPGFTLVAVMSMAIGVGANAAMFSVADGMLFRPLPVPRPGEVVTVSGRSQDIGFFNRRLSYPEYVDVRDRTKSFRAVVAYTVAETTVAGRPGEQARRKVGMAVSGNFFSAVDVQPALGRSLLADEDVVPGRDAVVVLDYDEWTDEFGSDAAIVGRRVRLGGAEFSVIGVTPRGFTGIDHDVKPAFYIPLAMRATVQGGTKPDMLTDRDTRLLVVKARLAPGVSMADARLELEQLATNLQRAYPDTNRDRGLAVQTEFEALRETRADVNLFILLLVLALVVLAIACANIAGLMTSRAPDRARELALRLAIGAGRTRVVRQLVTESVLIATGGAALGLLFGYVVIAAFQRLEVPSDLPLKVNFELDRRALGVGIAAAAIGAIVSSLLPAWQATRTSLVNVLKGSPGARESRHSRTWGRSVLVCGQVALSLVLLTVTVFMYRAFESWLNQGPGFRTEHLLLASFEPSLARYDNARATSFFEALKSQVQALPTVTAVSYASTVPMGTDNQQNAGIAPEGFQLPPGSTSIISPMALVDDAYFDPMGIRIVEGRGFRPGDDEAAPRVVVVNQRFAARYWPGQSAIGRRIEIKNDERRLAEVVGVAADSKYFFIIEAPVDFMYVPRAQRPVSRTSLLVVTRGPSAALAEPVRAIARSIDPAMPVLGLRTIEEFYASRVTRVSRVIVGTVGGMGTTGVLLAMVGLYGLVVHWVSRRRREIGIRIAVGAAPGSVLRMMLRQGLTLAVVGIVIGVIGSMATGGLLAGVFQNTSAHDLVTYAAVVPVLVTVTLLSALIPARRASHTDPLTALRQD